jgi:hypothetical protein
MKIFETMKSLFVKVKSSLTNIDNQPLSKPSLVIILFLDIFILISIFDGLDNHTRQFSTPDDYIPYSCREIVIDSAWNSTNRIENISSIILSNNNSYEREEIKKEHHPICLPYLELVDQMKVNKVLIAFFEDRNKFEGEANSFKRDIDNLKGAYETSLLETIAQQNSGQANVDTIKKEIREKTTVLNTLLAQIDASEKKINGNKIVTQLWMKLELLQPSDREKLKSDLRVMTFWYPVKHLGMQLLFLVPLFIIFFIWNSISQKMNRSIQALVSSHLLIISFVPIFFALIETVYEIIPKILLKKLIDLLVTLRLVALWNYLIIGLSVVAALFLIYIFQKKFFSQEKLTERRIIKNQCQKCGKHLPHGSQACPFCGFLQFMPCKTCNQQTLVYGKYCKSCGTEQ